MQTRRSPAAPPSGTHVVQQKDAASPPARAALRGQSYEAQERMLAPPSDAPAVQRKGEGQSESDATASTNDASGNAQQGGTSKPSDGFSNLYRGDDGKVATDNHGGADYDTYLASLGPIKASSEHVNDKQRKHVVSARTMTTEMTGDDLVEICNPKFLPAAAHAGPQSDEDRAELVKLTPDLNNAFRIMKLDTIGAQAAYLANAVMESSSFRYFTETQFVKDKAYRQDGGAILDTNDLDSRQQGKGGKVGGLEASSAYKAGGSIDTNKAGNTATDEAGKQAHWNQAFIGRGPLQVTHDYGYASTIAVLEKRQQELEAEKQAQPADQPNPQLDADLALVAEAVTKIKANPAEAANRKYAFLFSAAYEKAPRGKDGGSMDKSATMWSKATAGMGAQGSIGEVKQQIFVRAMSVLQKRLDLQAKQKAEAEKKAEAEQGG